MAELVILTGASRGMGLAMAEQLLRPGLTLVTLERKPAAELAAQASAAGATLVPLAFDLTHAEGAAAGLAAWLHGQRADAFASATLINNAGIVGRVGPIEQDSAASVAAVMRVDLEAPMLLTQAFLLQTAAWAGSRRVLNISSGAGRRAIAGWAAYCTAKAGIDQFTRVVALDEARKPNGAKIVSLAPGVIDTGMQDHLRAADASGFPDLARFVDLKNSGQLTSPADAAARVLAYLARDDFGSEPIADVRG
ncbi:MAG: SDR family NAD(P)-dependent oxidoreductase [Burkholderiaceae bacterium]